MANDCLKQKLENLTSKLISKMAARIEDTDHMLQHANQYKCLAMTLEKLAKVVDVIEASENNSTQEQINQSPQESHSNETDLQKLEILHATRNYFEGQGDSIRTLINAHKKQLAKEKFGLPEYCPFTKNKQIETSYYDT